MQLHARLLEKFVLLISDSFFIAWVYALQNNSAKRDKVNWSGFLLHLRKLMPHILPVKISPVDRFSLVVIFEAALVFAAIRQNSVMDDAPGWVAYPIHLLVAVSVCIGPAVPLSLQVFDAYSGSNF